MGHLVFDDVFPFTILNHSRNVSYIERHLSSNGHKSYQILRLVAQLAPPQGTGLAQYPAGAVDIEVEAANMHVVDDLGRIVDAAIVVGNPCEGNRQQVAGDRVRPFIPGADVRVRVRRVDRFEGEVHLVPGRVLLVEIAVLQAGVAVDAVGGRDEYGRGASWSGGNGRKV